jgi:hypothetical protein
MMERMLAETFREDMKMHLEMMEAKDETHLERMEAFLGFKP